MKPEPRIPLPYYLPRLLTALAEEPDPSHRAHLAAQLAALSLFAVGWSREGVELLALQFPEEPPLRRLLLGYDLACRAGEWSQFEWPAGLMVEKGG